MKAEHAEYLVRKAIGRLEEGEPTLWLLQIYMELATTDQLFDDLSKELDRDDREDLAAHWGWTEGR